MKRINPNAWESMESYPKFSNWKQVIARMNPTVGEALLGHQRERMKPMRTRKDFEEINYAEIPEMENGLSLWIQRRVSSKAANSSFLLWVHLLKFLVGLIEGKRQHPSSCII